MRRDKIKQFWNDNKFNIGMVVGGMAAMAGFAVGTKIARQQSQSVVDAMPFNRMPSRTLVFVPQGSFEKSPFTQYLGEAN